MANTKKRKFRIRVILWPSECTYIYCLAHYEKRLDIPDLTYELLINVTTLLENPKGLVELGNPNTCAEVKHCYLFVCFIFLPVL